MRKPSKIIPAQNIKSGNTQINVLGKIEEGRPRSKNRIDAQTGRAGEERVE